LTGLQKSFFTKRRCLEIGRGARFVGILNLTPDSFSDGGEFCDQEKAEVQFLRMVSEGATIIDVGGESTRPGHTPVSVEEEISRVVHFIRSIRPKTEALISIDTSKAAVADAALAAGADILNDVWGAQRDPEMAAVIAGHQAACVLMHNRPAAEAGEGDVVEAIRSFLERSINLVLSAGVREDAILLDPGLGFGKTYAENWEVMRRLDELKQIGYPLLLGASRKSMIAKLLDLQDPKARLAGTLGTTALAVRAGVEFIRVHDVRENRECAQVIEHCLKNE
jgi:dihydropteroate synthase